MAWCHNVLLTQWGRVTHICISKLNIIGSDNGLSPGRRQAIIWTNAGILLIRPLGINKLQWNLYISIQENALENIVWKMAAILSRPQCVKTMITYTWLGRYWHWGMNKIADIVKTFADVFSLKENLCILSHISLNFVLKGSTLSQSVSVHIIGYYLLGTKPLAVSMLTL